MAQCELSVENNDLDDFIQFLVSVFWQSPFSMAVHESVLQIQIESWCKSYPSLQKKSCILTWTV